VKRVIIGLFLSLATTQTASAFDLESPRGISQNEWNKSSEYQNFQCPTNTARGEGVDMNFTTNRADDFYYVTCTPIQVPTKIEIVETITAVAVITPQPFLLIETKTVTDTPTTVIDTATALSDTSTAVNLNGFDWSLFWVQFEMWFKTFFMNFWGIRL
jgi:hypothetical protein